MYNKSENNFVESSK